MASATLLAPVGKEREVAVAGGQIAQECSAIARLVQGVGGLPEGERRIFNLLYREGRSREDAGRQLNLSSGDFDRMHSEMIRSLLRGAA